MKKFSKTLLLILVWAFLAPNVSIAQYNLDECTIKIKVHNFDENQIYFGYIYAGQQYIQDSLKVKDENGYFVFYDKNGIDEGLYFIYFPEKIYFEFIGHNGNMVLETELENLVQGLKVTGSPQNEGFKNFRLELANKRKKTQSIEDQLSKIQHKDSIKMLQNEINELEQKNTRLKVKYLNQYKHTFLELLIKATMQIDIPESIRQQGEEKEHKYFKAHYFDNYNFSDKRTLRTPVFHDNLIYYLEKLTVQNIDSIKKSVDYIMGKCDQNPDIFRFCLTKLSQKYESSNIMGMDAIFVYLAEKYYLSGQAYWANADVIKSIRQRVTLSYPLIGDKAPDFKAQNAKGEEVSLKEVLSKTTILLLYSPTCSHCGETITKLTTLYDEISYRQVNIIGICLDNEKDAWMECKQKYQQPWQELIDTTNHEVTYSYSVNQVPKIYIIGEDKKIIAKNLGVGQIESFLDLYFKNKR